MMSTSYHGQQRLKARAEIEATGVKPSRDDPGQPLELCCRLLGQLRIANRIGVTRYALWRWSQPVGNLPSALGGEIPKQHRLAIYGMARRAGLGHILTSDYLGIKF